MLYFSFFEVCSGAGTDFRSARQCYQVLMSCGRNVYKKLTLIFRRFVFRGVSYAGHVGDSENEGMEIPANWKAAKMWGECVQRKAYCNPWQTLFRTPSSPVISAMNPFCRRRRAQYIHVCSPWQGMV